MGIIAVFLSAFSECSHVAFLLLFLHDLFLLPAWQQGRVKEGHLEDRGHCFVYVKFILHAFRGNI
jgi:hypothetical protein